jgi:hypothetical protein
MDKFAVFMFLSAGAVSLFAFLSVTHWVDARATERRERERLQLLRKMAEQPAMLEAMREYLRDEDARADARARQRSVLARRDAIQGGVTVFAVGVALSVFLYMISPNKPIWAVGLILILVGLVSAGFAYSRPLNTVDGESRA